MESKIGSLANATHKPGGGTTKIASQKLEFGKKATSKIGSLDNAAHQPKGGDKKIESKKLDWKAESKVGSLDNAAHKPQGGNVKVGMSVWSRARLFDVSRVRVVSGLLTGEGLQ